ncbi:MAG: hypothetical protein C0402_14160 [Thermodesulfovibrio sp.]|nr:hypothetical protein [Thermodesulfovibrio sp.]
MVIMRNKYVLIAAGFVIYSCMVLAASAAVNEPLRPAVDTPLDSTKEETIDRMIGLSAAEVFERLKDMEFSLSEEFSARAVHRAFGNRKAEILARAIDALKFSMIPMLRGRVAGRSADLGVARRIFEVFPEEAVPALVGLYGSSDTVTKGNILRVSGRIAGGGIRRLLLAALDDKATCEQEDPEVGGEPLRLCDLAYNQLVLRYRIPKVLRAIGPVYRIEVRDYHIDLMKNLLQTGEIR